MRAAGVLVVKLLPVLDVLDLAQAHFAGEANEERRRSSNHVRCCSTRSKRKAWERIDGVGVLFDPQVHDAVAHVPSDDGETDQVVDDVLRAGYRWKGAVLRPAMVRVKG